MQSPNGQTNGNNNANNNQPQQQQQHQRPNTAPQQSAQQPMQTPQQQQQKQQQPQSSNNNNNGTNANNGNININNSNGGNLTTKQPFNQVVMNGNNPNLNNNQNNNNNNQNINSMNTQNQNNAVPINQSIQILAKNKANNLTPILKEYAKEYASFQQQQQQFFNGHGNRNMNNNQNNNNMNGHNNNNNNHSPNKKNHYRDNNNSDLDNTNLYIKGLWKDCTQVELDDIFKDFGVISQSRVYGDGVGFVRFEQGFEAKAAIEAMDKAKLDRCPDQLLVKYAFKKVRRDKRYIRVGDEVQQYDVEMIMNKNQNNVYLRCLPRGFTETQLTELCEPYGELTCTRLRESGVAFVRYRKPDDAQNAIRKLNGKRFDGHNECLLAKLANSDPFQPKIGFKEHASSNNNNNNFGNSATDDGDENDTMSTNTMTPSQDAAQFGQPQQQQTSTRQPSRTLSPNQSQQQQQQQQQVQGPYHPQPVQPHHYAPHSAPYGHPGLTTAPHHYGAPPMAPNGYDQRNPTHPYGHPGLQTAPPHYGAPYGYDQRIHPAAYGQYAPPPPQYGMDPNMPQYAHPYGAPPPPTVPPQYGHPYGQTAYMQPYAQYNGYPHAQPQYVQPNLQQPVTPNPVPTQSITPNTTMVPKVLSPKQVAEENAVKNAPPYIPTSQQRQQGGLLTGKAPLLTKSQSDKTSSKQTQPITATLTPAQMHKVLNGKAPSTVYIGPPQQQHPGSVSTQPMLYATATPNQFHMISHPISPPGSELSFKNQDTLSAVAANVAELVMNPGPSRIAKAGKQIIPITPTADTTNLTTPIGNSLLGQISPGPGAYTLSAHEWYHANTSSNKSQQQHQQNVNQQQLNANPIESIDNAVKNLNIVKDVNEEKKDLEESGVDKHHGDKVGDVAKMQRKESNPLGVDKATANLLHQTISKWYPKLAGKLTGMFLQNHDQDRTVKYLERQERLKKKIETFAELLSNQALVPKEGASSG